MSQASWLEVVEVKDSGQVQRLLFWLDTGESAAIVLAKEQDLTLLIDERRGRMIASTLGVSVTGTIGVLLAAKARGYVLSVTPLLDKLIQAGVRISPRLYEEARLLANEG